MASLSVAAAPAAAFVAVLLRLLVLLLLLLAGGGSGSRSPVVPASSAAAAGSCTGARARCVTTGCCRCMLRPLLHDWGAVRPRRRRGGRALPPCCSCTMLVATPRSSRC